MPQCTNRRSAPGPAAGPTPGGLARAPASARAAALYAAVDRLCSCAPRETRTDDGRSGWPRGEPLPTDFDRDIYERVFGATHWTSDVFRPAGIAHDPAENGPRRSPLAKIVCYDRHSGGGTRRNRDPWVANGPCLDERWEP